MRKPDIYYTRSESGYTFRVVIDGHMIQIFSAIPDLESEDKTINVNNGPLSVDYELTPALFYKNVRAIWIPYTDDNITSILFEIHHGEYVFVGNCVLKFKPLAKISKFKSDGLYDSWVLDINRNYYLLNHQVYIMPVDSFIQFKEDSKHRDKLENNKLENNKGENKSFQPHRYLLDGEKDCYKNGVVTMTYSNTNMEILVESPYAHE